MMSTATVADNQFHALHTRIQKIADHFRDAAEKSEHPDGSFADELTFLFSQLQNLRAEIRMRASEVLATYPGPLDSTPILLAIESEEEPFVRASLVSALSRCDDPKSLAALRLLLSDANSRIRANSIELLARFQVSDLPSLARGLLADPNNRVLVNAALAYYPTDPTFILELFQKILAGQDDRLKDSVVYGLKTLGDDRAHRLLIELLETSTTPEHLLVTIIHALGQSARKSLARRLRPFLKSENLNILITTLEALAALGDTKCAPQVEPFLFHENEWVQAAAARCLRAMNGEGHAERIQSMRVLAFLRNCPLFRDFKEGELRELAGRIVFRELQAGETLFLPGQEATEFIIQQTGAILLKKVQGGEEKVHSRIQNGECFGDYEILSRSPHVFKAEAEVASRLFTLPKKEFLSLLEAHPTLLTAIYLNISGRMARSTRPNEGIAEKRELVALVAARPGIGQTRVARDLAGQIETAAGKRVLFLENINTQSRSNELIIPITETLLVILPRLKEFCPAENDRLFLPLSHLSRVLAILNECFDILIFDLQPNPGPVNLKILSFATRVLYLSPEKNLDSAADQELLASLAADLPTLREKTTFISMRHPVRDPASPAGSLPGEATPFTLFLPLSEDRANQEITLARLRGLARKIARRRVGLALSSGSAHGLAHLGVIQALTEAGVPIDVVSGSGLGALVAAHFALGFGEKQLARLAEKFTQKHFNRIGDFNYGLFFGNRSGLLKGRILENLLSASLGRKKFSDAAFELVITASDLHTGEQVSLESGYLHKAVSHSLAIPVLFATRAYQGRQLAEGGLTEPVPLTPLLRKECDFLLASNVARWNPNERGGVEERQRRTNILNVFLSSLDVLKSNLARHSGLRPDLEIRPDCATLGEYDFSACDRLVEAGRRAALEVLPEIQKLLRP